MGSNTRVNVTEGTFPHYTRTGHLVFARDSAIFGARFDPKSLTLASNPISVVSDLSMNSTTGAALFALSSSGTLVYRARVVTFAQRQMVWVSRSGTEEVISEDRRPYLQPGSRRTESVWRSRLEKWLPTGMYGSTTSCAGP